MEPQILEFDASGTPAALASAIEVQARQSQGVSALVVPWESQPDRLQMSVSAVRGDGWAIEHTNLGTIVLTDLGDRRTRVSVLRVARVDGPLGSLLDRFAGRIQHAVSQQPPPGATAS